MANTSLNAMPGYSGLHFILSQVEDNSHEDNTPDINDVMDEEFQLERLEEETIVVNAHLEAFEESYND